MQETKECTQCLGRLGVDCQRCGGSGRVCPDCRGSSRGTRSCNTCCGRVVERTVDELTAEPRVGYEWERAALDHRLPAIFSSGTWNEQLWFTSCSKCGRVTGPHATRSFARDHKGSHKGECEGLPNEHLLASLRVCRPISPRLERLYQELRLGRETSKAINQEIARANPRPVGRTRLGDLTLLRGLNQGVTDPNDSMVALQDVLEDGVD